MSVMFVRLLRLTTTTSEVIFVIQVEPLGGYKYTETVGFGFQNKFFN